MYHFHAGHICTSQYKCHNVQFDYAQCSALIAHTIKQDLFLWSHQKQHVELHEFAFHSFQSFIQIHIWCMCRYAPVFSRLYDFEAITYFITQCYTYFLLSFDSECGINEPNHRCMNMATRNTVTIMLQYLHHHFSASSKHSERNLFFQWVLLWTLWWKKIYSIFHKYIWFHMDDGWMNNNRKCAFVRYSDKAKKEETISFYFPFR